MPLTDLACRRAKSDGKPIKLSDDKGLYLLVKSSGRYWRWDCRFGDKRKTMALGVYPEVGLAQARADRDTARKLLAKGSDPMAGRKIDKLGRQQIDAVRGCTVHRAEQVRFNSGRLLWRPGSAPIPCTPNGAVEAVAIPGLQA